MLDGLWWVERGHATLLFVRMFFGSPSHLREDAEGEAHSIAQGEGGEQGDPIMFLLFAMGQHHALPSRRGVHCGSRSFTNPRISIHVVRRRCATWF